MFPFDLDLSRLGYVATTVIIVIVALSVADRVGQARAMRKTRRLISQYETSTDIMRGEAGDT